MPNSVCLTACVWLYLLNLPKPKWWRQVIQIKYLRSRNSILFYLYKAAWSSICVVNAWDWAEIRADVYSKCRGQLLLQDENSSCSSPVHPGAILKAEMQTVDQIVLFWSVCLSWCQLNSPSMVTACVWRFDLLWHPVFQTEAVVCIRDWIVCSKDSVLKVFLL